MADIAFGEASGLESGLWKEVLAVHGPEGAGDIVRAIAGVVLEVCGEDDEGSMPLKRGGARDIERRRESGTETETETEATTTAVLGERHGANGRANTKLGNGTRSSLSPASVPPNYSQYLIAGFCIALCGILFDRVYGTEENDDDDNDEDEQTSSSSTTTTDSERERDSSSSPPSSSSPRASSLRRRRRTQATATILATLTDHPTWSQLIDSKVLSTTRAIQRRCLGGARPERNVFGFDAMNDLAPGQLMALLQSQLGGMHFSQFP